jgi:hypothetical protein
MRLANTLERVEAVFCNEKPARIPAGFWWARASAAKFKSMDKKLIIKEEYLTTKAHKGTQRARFLSLCGKFL